MKKEKETQGKGPKKLVYKERAQIELLIKQGASNGDIAKVLGRNKSTITKEINANKGGPLRKHYSADFAQSQSKFRRYLATKMNPSKAPPVWEYVEEKLKEGWSPEIISGRIEKDHPELSVSHETIYAHVYQEWDRLSCYLPSRRIQRRPKGPRKPQKSKIPNRLSILERPEIINTRKEVGHWESDSIVSRKSKTGLNVMVERKTRLVKITKIPNLTATETHQAIIAKLSFMDPMVRKSITYDNGGENAKHEEINQAFGMKSYFCQPYHSWEKGSVEQMNMLIRRYVPKGTDLSKLTDEQIETIETALNDRPRKCLDYQTPIEVLNTFL